MDVNTMTERLGTWARAHAGPRAAVTQVATLPGHSGISFGFELTGDQARDRLVIRIPPAGVSRTGIADVVRQVPLLGFMERSGVPVPRVRWWGEDERWFGVPYLIVDYVPGATLGDVFSETSEVADAEPLFVQAVEALVRIHAADWRVGLAGWDAPRRLGGEVERYLPLLRRSPERDWVTPGEALATALGGSVPPEPVPAVVHNDFYSNNWMFEDGRLTGVLDWEGTFIGAPLLDLGWLSMMYDPPSWSPAHRARIHWSPPVELIAELYDAASGSRPASLDWYRAFAGYRLASLTAYYLHLHRRGRRPDPAWESLAESVPYMLERATALTR